MGEEEFAKWRDEKKMHFFYCASKGNIEAIGMGEGGIIFDPEGIERISFSCGLG
jgi:hypothetical protein